ncbi:MAG: class I SAM-dependent methyltransferase [Acidimicrobiales bacterium]
MPEVDLLARYPQTRRDVRARSDAKTPENVAAAKRFGREYFDGDRSTGYGGYRYDGRWVPVAEDIVAHFGLNAASSVLDVGCAKGFLLTDLRQVVPGIEVFGLDISEYGLRHARPEVGARCVRGNARDLPFADGAVDVVLSINTLHNLDRVGCVQALREIARVGRHGSFVQVDSYRTPEQRKLFLEWVLTAETHADPRGWEQLFAEAGYAGDYGWTIVEQPC